MKKLNQPAVGQDLSEETVNVLQNLIFARSATNTCSGIGFTQLRKHLKWQLCLFFMQLDRNLSHPSTSVHWLVFSCELLNKRQQLVRTEGLRNVVVFHTIVNNVDFGLPKKRKNTVDYFVLFGKIIHSHLYCKSHCY